MFRKLRYLLKSWAMWRGISAKPKRNKWMYLDHIGIKNTERPLYNCFLCGYMDWNSECLVDWGEGKNPSTTVPCGYACEQEGTLYRYWFHAINYETPELALAYAAQIARLHKETIKRLIKDTLRWR